ncbi:MAG: hypothetical protein KBS89_02010 [Bacteroidales bacterium]|nr:hypothetical protein [Candidatus Egerieousia equi]
MNVYKKIKILSIVLAIATVFGIATDITACVVDCIKGWDEVMNASDEIITAWEAIGTILVIPYFIALTILIVKYIGIITNVKRGNLFSVVLEKNFRCIGIAMIALYAIRWGMCLCLQCLEDGSPALELCCGIMFIIVSYIFELARNMKEDQEFLV